MKYYFRVNNIVRRSAGLFFALMAIIVLSGCPTPGEGDETIAVLGVSINKNEISLAIDGTEQLAATVKPADADDKSVVWSSGSATVATVSDTGLVTGIAAGTTTVTVKTNDGSKTAVCAVTISEAAPTEAPSALSYSKYIGSYVVGIPIAENIPTVTGTVTAYTVSPDLPAGLQLSRTTGRISGTPTAVSSLQAYTITAANALGSTTAQIGIVIYATAGATLRGSVILPSSVSNKTYTVVVDTDHLGSNGGQVAYARGTVTGSSFTYEMENVPTGSFNIYAIVYAVSSGTGAPVSGDFTSSDSTFVNISGIGNFTANRVCNVSGKMPPITEDLYFWYPDFYRSYLVGTAISAHTPVWPHSWSVGSYAIDPALPAGLAFNTATGAITGTPTTALGSPERYSVTAIYENGSISTVIGMNVSNAAGATITGTITLPVSLANKNYTVQVDTDHDGDNGGVVACTFGTVTGNSFTYSIENIPDGSFMVYAIVYDVGNMLNEPVPGDYGNDNETVLTVSGTGTFTADRSCSLLE